MSERPDFIQDIYLEYLSNLRISGIVNMFGAVPYLINKFPGELTVEEARYVLGYWIKNFGEYNR